MEWLSEPVCGCNAATFIGGCTVFAIVSLYNLWRQVGPRRMWRRLPVVGKRHR